MQADMNDNPRDQRTGTPVGPDKNASALTLNDLKFELGKENELLNQVNDILESNITEINSAGKIVETITNLSYLQV